MNLRASLMNLGKVKLLVLCLAVVGVPAVWLHQAKAGAEPAPVAAPKDGKRVLVVKQASYQAGLKAVVGITGRTTESPVSVQVLRNGKPAPGEVVEFRIVGAPGKGKGALVPATLSEKRVTTDAKGYAKTKFKAGNMEGTYLVAAFVKGSVNKHPPVVTKFNVYSPAWAMFLVFGLIGGLGLFLFGMNLAGDNLQKAAGEQMRVILQKLTKNRVMGLLLGTIASGVLQSSSAAAVMLVGFVSAAMMTLTQAIAVVMGTKIGVTITIQLIAFDLSKYALGIVGIGAIVIIIAGSKRKMMQIGSIILGFGLIFFGLSVMSGAMKPLRGMPEFAGLMLKVSSSAGLAILLGAAFTGIIQSAVATTAIAMALAAQGLLGLEAAIGISIGSAVGTCATALLASLGASRDGKRLAWAHVVFSVTAALIFLPLMGPYASLVKTVTSAMGSESVIRQVANGFMFFSIITGFALLPFTSLFEKASRLIIRDKEEEEAFGPLYINKAALGTPVIAIDLAHKEVCRMGDLLGEQLEATMPAIEKGDADAVDALIEEHQNLETLERAVRRYLATIAQSGLADTAAARERGLLYLTEHIESAGHQLTDDVLKPAALTIQDGKPLHENEIADQKRFHEKLMDKHERVMKAVRDGDHAMAERTLQLKFKENQLMRKLRGDYLTRIAGGDEDTLKTSRVHLHMLGGLGLVAGKLDEAADEILHEW